MSLPAHNVPGAFCKGLLKVLSSGTYNGPSADFQGTKTKICDLMKKLIFRCNSPCITHLFLFFYRKDKYSKVLNRYVHMASTGPSCGTSRGPNDGTFWGRPWDVGRTCFLGSIHKHIKLTVTG